MNHRYLIAPYLVASDWVLEQPLAFIEQDPDILVRRALESPQLCGEALFSGEGYVGNERELLYNIAPGYTVRVTEGREILLHTNWGNPLSITDLLIRNILPIAFLQRGWLLLHGAANASADGASIFLGASGAGKSTLNAALALSGAPSLGDDIIAVNVIDNSPVVAPFQPRIHLNHQSMSLLGLKKDAGRPVAGDKFSFAVQKMPTLHTPQPIKRFFILESPSSGNATIRPMSSSQGLRALLRHLLDPMVPAILGDTHLALIAGLASSVRFSALNRGQEQLDQFVSLVTGG